MSRMQALAALGLTYEDLVTIRRSFLRSLEQENRELMHAFGGSR